MCASGSTEACYDGPSGTQGVGACKAGLKTCLMDGSGYGPCVGEVTPIAESCATAADDDCDGQANEPDAGCVCTPGATQTCYDGPAGTVGVGICVAGQKTCASDGKSFTYYSFGFGYTDSFRSLHPNEPNHFTYWDYFRNAFERNRGIRIDHFLLSPALAPALRSSTIDRAPRAEPKPSDHTPLLIDLAL